MVVGRSTDFHCLTYLPYSYTGRGPAESSIQILKAFGAAGLDVTLFLPRFRRALPDNINVVQSLPPGLRRLPWSLVGPLGQRLLDQSFIRAMGRSDPKKTILYFWPDPPIELLSQARARGFTIVREMINSACATSRPILDEAYARQGLAPSHRVTAEKVAAENAELALYDHIFVSNPEVEKSLVTLGIAPERIWSTTFGWQPERFAGEAASRPADSPLRVAFVGSIGIRKGVPELIAAWEQAGVEGELLLAGGIEDDCREHVEPHFGRNGIRHLDYVEDIGALYRSCDFFVFPTLEEGGPQVTYEAAGCGLPIIATPMGAARLVENDVTGLIVPPGDTAALAGAIRRLAGDRPTRERMGAAARAAAEKFRYDVVGRQRADYLIEALRKRSRQNVELARI